MIGWNSRGAPVQSGALELYAAQEPLTAVTGVSMPCDVFPDVQLQPLAVLGAVQYSAPAVSRIAPAAEVAAPAPVVEYITFSCRFRRTSACGRNTSSCGGMLNDGASCRFFLGLRAQAQGWPWWQGWWWGGRWKVEGGRWEVVVVVGVGW